MHPQRIGKYELSKFLGGGMSHVYKAVDTLIGRTVAVKILTESGALDEGTKARFIREAQLAGNVIHENIIRVYDFGDEQGQLFMVMEFLEGEDLSDAIRNGHTGTIPERLSTAVQIAKAMEHVHSLGIVHRDLKPHNVYITRSGVAKLMDFGIAKTDQTSMTKTGFTVGTPSYMAPEQVLGKQVNHQSDIYSFGIMLFELVTGQKPLGGDSVERVFWQILNEPVDLTPMRQAGASEAVVNLVRWCTEKDPAKRPQGFHEVRRALDAAIAPALAAAPAPAPAPVVVPPQPVAAQTGNKWVMPAAVGVVALLVVAAVLAVMLRKHPEPAKVVASTAPVAASAPVIPAGMVLVPAGSFLFGEKGERQETPAYYVDKTEVSNGAYGDFLKQTGYAAPPGFAGANADYPVANVTMADAREYARWAGKRLPSAFEWEKAARGVDGRKYPWGNDPKPIPTTLQPAADPQGPSPFGAVQMLGNVWELVDEKLTPSPRALQDFAARLTPKPTAEEAWCQIRGGSYKFPLLPVYEWSAFPERYKTGDVGFRCVRDLK